MPQVIMNPPVQLLFFDTFEHKGGSDEDVSVDLIKFSSQPVVVREIRIVPSCMCVALEPSVYTQGFTMPQSFVLEIFANNLGRSAACTFEKIGCFEYRHDKDVKFSLPSYIATDGLLIRGRYKFISIALYGEPVPTDAQAQTPSASTPLAQTQIQQSLQSAVVASPCTSTSQLTSTVTPTVASVASPAISPPGMTAPPSATVYQSSSSAVINLTPNQNVSLQPQSQPPQNVIPAMPGWSAPTLQIITGIAPFNPLVPPPLSSATQMAPYQGIGALQPPGISGTPGAVYGAATFDLSRPPPTLSTLDSASGQPQAPPGVSLSSSNDETNVVVVPPPHRKRARSRSSSGSRRHRRRRSASNDTSTSKKHKRSSPCLRPSRNKVSQSKRARSPSVKRSGSSKRTTATAAFFPPSLATVAVPKQPCSASSSGADGHLEEGEYGNTDEETIAERLNFETISDEECDAIDNRAIEIDETELNEDIIKHARFNPCTFDGCYIKHFKLPNLTEYEKALMAIKELDVFTGEFSQSMDDLWKVLRDFGHDRSEKWVLFLERLLPNLSTFLAYLLMRSIQQTCLDTLVIWLKDGLNIKLATKHTQPPFIIRHLKTGIKLSEQLLLCSENIARKVLQAVDVQNKLLDLYNADYMSLPLKLMIVKTLDSSLYFTNGYETFISQVCRENESTPYQRITYCLLNNPGSRITASIEALLRKVRFCDILRQFSDTVRKVKTYDSDNNEGYASVTDCVTDLLQDILHFYKSAEDLLTQPAPTILPVSTVLEKTRADSDALSFIFSHFSERNFAESLLLLLSHPLTHEDSKMVGAICNVLNRLIESNVGLCYLANCSEFVRNLSKLSLPHSVNESQDEEPTCSVLQNTTLDMVYRLQALNLVDQLLFNINGSVVQHDVDNPDIISLLQRLFILTFDQSSSISSCAQNVNNRGKRAVVGLLSSDNNLACILPFIDLNDNEELDIKIKKSACACYATELLLITLQSSDSVELLKSFGERLLAICSKDSGSKVSEIKQWIDVLRKLPAFNYESVEYLCEKIKSFVEQENFGSVIQPELITALRILKFLVVPQDDVPFSSERSVEELKYKYAIMQTLYFGALPILTQIIDKLAELHALNWQQGISLNNRCGSLFYACVLPTLSVIKHCLSYLIHCRNDEFRDVTTVGPLLKMYAVCCSMLPASGIGYEVFQIQQEIISTLLSFTQPDVSAGLADLEPVVVKEKLKRSLWTMIIVEIIKFTNDSICNFVAGLSVLSELLPLPLPLQTQQPLNAEEIRAIMSKRHLWSLHLTPLDDRLSSLVENFCMTTNANLQQATRRVFLQLCDLSPDVAKIIAMSLFGTLLNLCEQSTSSNDDSKRGDVKQLKLPATLALSHPLNLVSYLSSHAPFKCVFLDLICDRKDSADSDQIRKMLSYFIEIFNHTSSSKNHQLCQQQITTTLQSLCDDSIGLLRGENGAFDGKHILHNCLPEQQQLNHICSALLRNIVNKKQPYATVLPALRILLTLSEHDYGIHVIKTVLDSEATRFLSLLERLIVEFSARNSDCICTLNAFLQLIDNLHSAKDNRSNKLGINFILQILDWHLPIKSSSPGQSPTDATKEDGHPFLRLQNLIGEFSKEDDSLTRILNSVQELINYLSREQCGDETVITEPFVAPLLTLDAQFEKRQVYVICKDDFEDRLTAQYWFPNYVLEAEDGDGEKVESDLESLRQKFFSTYDLATELKNKFAKKRADDTSLDVPARKIKRTIINTSRGERRRFIAPLRGRGRDAGYGARPPMVSSRMPNDPFRNRPPNTSRPPSLHVDDFLIVQQKSNPNTLRSKAALSLLHKKNKKR